METRVCSHCEKAKETIGRPLTKRNVMEGIGCAFLFAFIFAGVGMSISRALGGLVLGLSVFGALTTVVTLVMVGVLVRRNGVGCQLYLFEGDGTVHRHMNLHVFPFGVPGAIVFHIRVGGWFKKCSIAGPPDSSAFCWQLESWTGYDLRLTDWYGNVLGNQFSVAEMLEIVRRFTTVPEVFRELRSAEEGRDYLGRGIEDTILWIVESRKILGRSKHAHGLRERLDNLLQMQSVLPKGLRKRWQAEVAKLRATKAGDPVDPTIATRA